MPIKYIGKPTNYRGKTLWEIIGNLKNFGVGRIIVRSQFERYPEPSFIKVVEVQALPKEDTRKVLVSAERVFRGRKDPNLVPICRVSYKPDFRLLHKDEEASYCKYEPSAAKEGPVLPKTSSFPPLLRELLLRDQKKKGELPMEPQLNLLYKQGKNNVAQVETDDKRPTVTISPSVGNPKSPQLYIK